MSYNTYDPIRVLARSKQWHAEAAVAAVPSVRAYCLAEAARCEKMVEMSLQTPVLADPADDNATPRRFGH